jgi:hypothetical protein
MKNDAKRTSTGLSLKEAMHLQALEGNPLDAEDIAMFEMFEREGWSQAKRIAYILDQASKRAITPAAE